MQRALRLMETVASHPNGAPAKQLAREARLPLATTYHLLRTLAHEGYATRLPDGVWVLGERVETLHGQSRTQQLLARVRPTLVALRDELNVAAYFGMQVDDEIRLIDIADGPRAPASTCGSASRTPRTPPRWASACSASSTTTGAATTVPAPAPRPDPAHHHRARAAAALPGAGGGLLFDREGTRSARAAPRCR